jgi:hypothetical protein
MLVGGKYCRYLELCKQIFGRFCKAPVRVGKETLHVDVSSWDDMVC